MRRLVYILLVLTMAVGCSETPTEEPAEDDTLIELLLELHLADGRIRLQNESNPSLRDSILSAYGYTDESFEAAMEPYRQEPEALVALYSSVLDRLNQESIQ